MQNFLDIILNGPARYTVERHLNPGLTLVIIIGALLIEASIAYIIILLVVKAAQQARVFTAFALRRFGVGKREITYTFLRMTFPTDTSKSAYATEQLHIIMRDLVKYRGFWERLAGRKQPYSLELVATRDNGIRYVTMVPAGEVETIRRTLLSFLPGLKVEEAEDYLTELSGSSVGVVELAFKSDYILPLEDNKALAEHDPTSYLTGHMRSLAPGELVAFQIVAVPVLKNTHSVVVRREQNIRNRIALSKDLSSQLNTHNINILGILFKLVVLPFFILTLVAKVISYVFIAISTNDLPKSSHGRSPGSNPYELELGTMIKQKIDQYQFEVSMRILVASPDANTISSRVEAIVSSFQPFSSFRQSIGVRKNIPLFSPSSKNLMRFKQRVLSPHVISQPTIVSSSELSDLYHFPNTDLTKTEGLIKNRSHELPAPLSLKGDNSQFDIVVGVNEFDGERSPIGMTLPQRQKHTYVIGKTGMGKTTLLMNSIYQDMENGKGLAVFDPHGDMFRELLRIVPEHRQKDVIVFDPSDRENPIGLNILNPGIDFEDDDDRQEWITSTVLSIFAKLSEEKQWGPRMEHILRSATLTALQTPNPSLYTLQRLLTDKKYQKEVAKNLKDPVLKQFWEKEFKLLGSMQMSSATAPLTHRLGHFITSKMSRHILMQEKSTVRIGDVMNEGKILLVNLSKGDIGEDQSFFFGTILTSFIWMAAYQRTKIPEDKRRDFFVYVDEFQNFATPRFSEITSEGRKFHVSLIVSHQNIAQIEDKSVVKIVAGNAATMICLKASPDDEDFILPYMKPEVKMGDIVNLEPYHFYMKTSGDVSEEAFSGQTIQLDVTGSDETMKTVVSYSRAKYSTPKADVEKYMESLFGSDSTKPVHVRKASKTKTAKSDSNKVMHSV
jgi:hypothetical protein